MTMSKLESLQGCCCFKLHLFWRAAFTGNWLYNYFIFYNMNYINMRLCCCFMFLQFLLFTHHSKGDLWKTKTHNKCTSKTIIACSWPQHAAVPQHCNILLNLRIQFRDTLEQFPLPSPCIFKSHRNIKVMGKWSIIRTLLSEAHTL